HAQGLFDQLVGPRESMNVVLRSGPLSELAAPFDLDRQQVPEQLRPVLGRGPGQGLLDRRGPAFAPVAIEAIAGRADAVDLFQRHRLALRSRAEFRAPSRRPPTLHCGPRAICKITPGSATHRGSAPTSTGSSGTRGARTRVSCRLGPQSRG